MRKIAFAFAALTLATTAVAMPASNRITLPNGRKIFVSGMNMAWITFASDVGDASLDTNKFREAVEGVRDAGGNALRVWLSTNGSNDPKFDSNTGLVSGLGTKTIANVKSMLSIANRNGVVLALDLLTHNLMAAGQVGDWNHMSIANNKKLMQTDAGLKAYIDNAVVPLVKAIGNDSGVLCWEVFNEPEGMVAGASWGLEPGITMVDIQRVVNRVAGAIHRAVPGILVSNGAVTFETTTDVDGMKNYYTDSALKAVGADADGYLDFYMVHYYGWNGVANSPFTKNFAHWKLDKPLVIGEFPANSWSPEISSKNKDAAKIDTLFTYLYASGYAGGMSWCYFGDKETWLGDITTSEPALRSVFKLDSASIKIKDVVRVKRSGNGVLSVGISNTEATVYPAIQYNVSKDFSKAAVFAVDLLVPKSAKGAIKVQPVLKTGDSWTWNASGVFCAPKNDSVWTTCSVPLAEFPTQGELGAVMAVLFQFAVNPSFEGQVWFDNVRIDKDTLWRFDDGKVVFGVDSYDPIPAEKIVGMDVVYPTASTSIHPRSIGSSRLSLRSVANGFEWARTAPLASSTIVRVVDTKGRELYRATAKAGSVSGFVPSIGSGLRFVVLENAAERDVRSLTSTR